MHFWNFKLSTQTWQAVAGSGEHIDRVMDRIQNMELKFETKMKKFDKEMDDVVKSVNFNGQNIQELKTQIQKLENKLKQERETVNQELDSMRSYISRENLLFHGLPDKEEKEDSENVLRQFFVEHLKLDKELVEKIEFQRAHRVNVAGRPRPIIARFLRYTCKEHTMVIQSAKNLNRPWAECHYSSFS